ncbi:beta-ketoacyl synthase [Kistimonas asteriae]|uniref:beta-ketoacyl synthase n=1 Tax=Kistimonas asteriae TaxID=517724 RepID=UPI001BA46FFF|nr:beta-ketoacyl synthase [Kistimonas asteriae]
MSRLPVIVAQGGIGPAGRTSGFNAYCRLVFEALGQTQATHTLSSLAALTGGNPADQQGLLDATLIRKLDGTLFDPDHTPLHNLLKVQDGSQLVLRRRQLPKVLPAGWQVTELDSDRVLVSLGSEQSLLVPATQPSPVYAAGQLPTGFHPETLYQSRNHPRGLAMTVYGASDALMSLGMPFDALKQKISPDQISVYAGSSMSQLDHNGNGGMLQARLQGKRVTSKQLPLGFAEMPADFINAYVLGSFGSTGTNMGACATFLYNLRQGINDIRSGRARLVIVGNSEAPLTPEVIDGYTNMGALASDKNLRVLDHLGKDDTPDYRRACRPFGENCGFTLAESAQFFVLMDDELAMATGAPILGAVADVFVNADGHKQSISGPGAGNYITFAKAVSLACSIFGDEVVRNHSFVQAHGSGTPQNRITESHILDEVARTFGITRWPVTAIKSRVGHSLATAAADQLMATLGVWQHGLIPGITSIDRIADDVHQARLHVVTDHLAVGRDALDIAFLNAKGFGGNNATAMVIAPHRVQCMLEKRHGQSAMTAWHQRNEAVVEAVAAYEQGMCAGTVSPLYRFGENVITDSDIRLSREQVELGDVSVSLRMDNPWADCV